MSVPQLLDYHSNLLFFSRSLNKWSKLFPWKWSWLKPRRSLLSTQDLSHETVQKAQIQTSTWNARHPLFDTMSYVNQGDMTLTRSSVWRMNLFTCLGEHGNQWLNHDLVLVGLTQNRRLLGKPVVGEPRWLRLGKQNMLQLFLDFCWVATGNWGEFCSCVGASKHRTLWLVTWCHLDTCQGAVYQQAPSLHLQVFQILCPCLFVRKFRPVTFVFLAIQIRGCSQKLQWKNSQRMWFHWPKHAFSTSPNVPWLHCTNGAVHQQSYTWKICVTGTEEWLQLAKHLIYDSQLGLWW